MKLMVVSAVAALALSGCGAKDDARRPSAPAPPTAKTSEFALPGRPEVEPAPRASGRHSNDPVVACGTVGWREYQVRAARVLPCAAALAAATSITKHPATSGWTCSYKITPKVRNCQRGDSVRYESSTLFIAQVRFASTALPWPDPRDV